MIAGHVGMEAVDAEDAPLAGVSFAAAPAVCIDGNREAMFSTVAAIRRHYAPLGDRAPLVFDAPQRRRGARIGVLVEAPVVELEWCQDRWQVRGPEIFARVVNLSSHGMGLELPGLAPLTRSHIVITVSFPDRTATSLAAQVRWQVVCDSHSVTRVGVQLIGLASGVGG